MTNTITTELRESMVDDARGLLYIGETALANLCDAIDAVHANLEAENESLRRELDRVLGEQEGRDGWVRLPLDADGVPVRLDDLMEWTDGSDEPFEVVGIGNGMLYYIDDDGIQWTRAETKRHYRVTTVEDVLREFAEKVTDSQIPGVHPTYEEAIAEYATKLRLAGES